MLISLCSPESLVAQLFSWSAVASCKALKVLTVPNDCVKWLRISPNGISLTESSLTEIFYRFWIWLDIP